MESETPSDMYDDYLEKPPEKQKFLSLSLFILLQGQFISVIGDTIYRIALGFWVLTFTGSTVIMGALMATSVLPAVLISPFAGVVVDRYNRQKLMIIMDIIRGITVIMVALAALIGILSLWMVFIAGIILGVCEAFFAPSALSIIPQMVPKDRLSNVNSLLGMANTGGNIIGTSIGGFLYVMIGAPLMFLFNGISFLISGISISFLKIPKNKRSKITSENFISDLKDAIAFIKNLKGLSYILIIFSIFSFLSQIAIILLIPFFQLTPGLGPAKYGIAMASFTVGMFFSMIIFSIIHIEHSKKAKLLFISFIISNVCFISFALTTEFYVMAVLLFLAGIAESVVNVFIFSSIQAVVPDNMIGKFMGLVVTLTSALTPLAMITGGILAEFFSIKTIFLVCFIACFLVIINLLFIPSFPKLINFDPEKQDINDLMTKT